MLDHWDEHGFGVWAVTTHVDPDILIGFTGPSHRKVYDRDALNLHYRHQPAAWGHGYASEGAREAMRLATEMLPTLPVVAYTTPDRIGSQRTAFAAGLLRREDLNIHHDSYTDVHFTRGW